MEVLIQDIWEVEGLKQRPEIDLLYDCRLIHASRHQCKKWF